jgi:hypothetical protein
MKTGKSAEVTEVSSYESQATDSFVAPSDEGGQMRQVTFRLFGAA